MDLESDRERTKEKSWYYNLPAQDGLELDKKDPIKPDDIAKLINLMGQAVILCDDRLRIIDYNPGAEIFLGKNKEAILTKGLFQDYFSSLADKISGQPENGTGELFVDRYRLPDGRISALKATLNPIRSKGNIIYYLVILTDVSDLVRAQQAAQNANIAKSQFVAHISHEIRTPLLGILGFCERLGRFAVGESQKESIETIESCANYLLNLVNNLLDISKIESQKVDVYKNQFSIRLLLKQVMLLVQPALKGKDLNLELELDASLPESLIGDEIKIRQVLSNLLVNAIKYTDSGIIKVTVCREPELSVENPLICSMRFSVADTGIGVAKSEMEKIFEPFVQVDRIRKDHGNGLGLAISKQLVEAMGGAIWCEPNYPRGSLFVFSLPLEVLNLNEGISEKKGEYAIQLFISRPTILLVEDIKVNRKLIQYMLEELGCKVIAVENGEKCLALLEKVVPDLILMDMQMPVLNGFEATSIIRKNQQWRNIPIIALTAYAMSGDVEKCLEVGCNYYLSKPFTRDQLYNLLERCLESPVDYSEIS